jgi:NhaP-type Na+/H+ or K+/H+ antiporter
MSRIWRFVLGAAIGIAIGYAAVLLIQRRPKASARPQFHTIYQAPSPREEEQTAA